MLGTKEDVAMAVVLRCRVLKTELGVTKSSRKKLETEIG